jgi:hypothetical protein
VIQDSIDCYTGDKQAKLVKELGVHLAQPPSINVMSLVRARVKTNEIKEVEKKHVHDGVVSSQASVRPREVTELNGMSCGLPQIYARMILTVCKLLPTFTLGHTAEALGDELTDDI